MAIMGPLRIAKAVGRRAVRLFRRYVRPNELVPLGDITAGQPGTPADLSRRTPGLFCIPGAFDLAPAAQLSGVTEKGERFFLSPLGDYSVLQGGCTDGKYAYLILENQQMVKSGASDRAECILCKVDMKTWQVAAKSRPLVLDHGNDLAYNPRTGLLACVHCYGMPNDISFIDPATLEIVQTKEYYHSVYGIAYNNTYDRYVMAIRGGYDFAIFSGGFELLRYVKGIDTRFVKQGIDCDDDYIYFVNSGRNALICYTWEGRYCGAFAVRGCRLEAENIFHRGNEWYMAFNAGGGRGGCVYRVSFDKAALSTGGMRKDTLEDDETNGVGG